MKVQIKCFPTWSADRWWRQISPPWSLQFQRFFDSKPDSHIVRLHALKIFMLKSLKTMSNWVQSIYNHLNVAPDFIYSNKVMLAAN